MCESRRTGMSWRAFKRKHTHTVGVWRSALPGTDSHDVNIQLIFLACIAGCLYSPSHLFSSHRQHAAALLHSDWLVLGPRAERSGTQAAEQVESQDRRGQRSLQGQTGVRPGHNRPPSELTRPANHLARGPVHSSVFRWLKLRVRPAVDAKGASMCSRCSPRRTTFVLILLFRSRAKNVGKQKKFSLHFRVSYEFLGINKPGCMASCFGYRSQWEKSVRVHDVNAEENLSPSSLQCLSNSECCLHGISHL